LFGYEGGFFSNMWDNRVIDVYQGKDAEHQKVILYKRNGNNKNNMNQKWKVVYLDEKKTVQSKGLVADFGFHANRPFYIRSRMPMQRVCEMHGNANIWLRRWRKNTKAQMWTFDPVRKVIKNVNWTNYAMEIQSNGGSSNLRATTTINSRWW
jgi:hypothetical protein